MNIIKNKHMIRTLLMVLFVHTISALVQAQCNNQLVDIAASQSGKDAVFVNEFKVKLNTGNKKQPSPVGHFSVLLKEGITYRFNVANANDYEGKAILQLCNKEQVLGSTYDSESKTDQKYFDYRCIKTSRYQVLMSFKEAKEGCAVGILSMIVDSSLISKKSNDSINEILYKDIWNPLVLNVSLDRGEYFDINIDSGKIERNNDAYSAFVSAKKYANVKITVFDSLNRPKESNSKTFQVEDLPLPHLSMGIKINNYISKADINSFPFVELRLPVSLDVQPYQLMDYTILKSEYSVDGLPGYGDRLTPAQVELINELGPGSKLIFKNIRIKHPNGRIINLPTAVFYIE